MQQTPNPDWRAACRSRGIDPAEVEMVSGRYLAYRDFMAGQGGGLALEAWFRFYRLEKASDSGQQAGVPVGGCSADGDAPKQAVLEDPAGFLELLRLRIAGVAPPGG